LQRLGMSQADALEFVLSKSKEQGGLVGLQGSDRALLDEAFGGAEANLRRFGNLMSQDLAGTRGLNRSDTPVSEAVLREMLPAMASLQSEKAGQSLGLGLNLANLNQNRLQLLLQGVGTSPNALLGLGDRFQSERFKGARNTQTITGSHTPSLMQSIGDGLNLASKIGSMGAAAYSGFSPGAAGLAGGGASSGGYGGGLGLSRGSVGSMFG
jgi:hypothetical protein